MDASGIAERLWQAVEERESALDGAFVYAVRSTGIYCRPTCPSRRPRRRVVQFFETPARAESAGFRACARCKPRDPRVEAPAAARVLAAARAIDSGDGDRMGLSELARRVGGSPWHLQRSFKRLLGVTPREYADARRARRFRASVRHGAPIASATFAAGYGSSSRLYERAAAELGMTPASYRRGAPGERIGYALAESPLGMLLVAATERGVCRVALGAPERELVGALRAEFPDAEVERDDASLRDALADVLARVRGAVPSKALPTDVRATAFQRRVWAELSRIPRGETRSYADVARRIGAPRASRAVAAACAANPTPIVVPCHRVVRSDGALGGYRFGEERKRSLLEREGALEGDRRTNELPSRRARRDNPAHTPSEGTP